MTLTMDHDLDDAPDPALTAHYLNVLTAAVAAKRLRDAAADGIPAVRTLGQLIRALAARGWHVDHGDMVSYVAKDGYRFAIFHDAGRFHVAYRDVAGRYTAQFGSLRSLANAIAAA